MGSPKPLLQFDGRTCVSLVLDSCLNSAGVESILVLGADAEAVRATLDPDPRSALVVVVNDRHEQGQTSSLKTGLEAVSPASDGFLIMPVDLPLVTAADLDAVIHRAEARPRGRTIFIAAHEGGRGHPALFLGGHREALLALPDAEPLREYIRLREGEVDIVPVNNPGIAMPMNTPDEYRRALTVWRARRGHGAGAS